MSRNRPSYLLSDPSFDPNKLREALLNVEQTPSPKVLELVKEISRLDKDDSDVRRTLYKHVIISSTDIGAVLAASALVAFGKVLVTRDASVQREPQHSVAVVSSKSPSSTPPPKEIIDTFNLRPGNTNGEMIRYLAIDRDILLTTVSHLKDVKYIHLLEPQENSMYMNRIMDLATKTCSQKGLKFEDWSLEIIEYDLSLPDQISKEYNGVNRIGTLASNKNNVSMKNRNTFSKQMASTAAQAAIDAEITSQLRGGGPLAGLWKGAQPRVPVPVPKQPAATAAPKPPTAAIAAPTTKQSFLQQGELISEARAHTADISQKFLQQYFTPDGEVDGMVLWHSAGTLKTCTAISIASTRFVPKDWTVLWVTNKPKRYWKHQFQHVCNEDLLNKISVITKPLDITKNKALLKPAWNIDPIRHADLKSMCLSPGSSDVRVKLEKVRQQTGDILRLVLLVIDDADEFVQDEAAYRGLMQLIDKSRGMSKELAVKLLLLTGSEFDETPMDLVKLVNLCKPIEKRMPDEQDAFAKKFMDPITRATFTPEGKQQYMDNMAGYVSRIDRKWDKSKVPATTLRSIITQISKRTQKGSPERVAKCNDAIKFVEEKMKFEAATTASVINDLRQALRSAKTNQAKDALQKDILYEKDTSTRYITVLNNAYAKLIKLRDESKALMDNNNSQQGALAKAMGKKSQNAKDSGWFSMFR
jgi:hypothetical protein